jgi:hypothetical protein
MESSCLSILSHARHSVGRLDVVLKTVVVHNMNGFSTETMYDYYIVMKSMFLVVKLSSHSSIDYVSLTILLP